MQDHNPAMPPSTLYGERPQPTPQPTPQSPQPVLNYTQTPAPASPPTFSPQPPTPSQPVAMADMATPPRRINRALVGLMMVGVLGLLATFGYWWLTNSNSARVLIPFAQPSPQPSQIPSQPDEAAASPVVEPSPLHEVAPIVTDVSPTPSASASPSGTPAASNNSIPNGWVIHSFPQQVLKIATPKGWQSEVESYSSTDAHVFRFWQGSSSQTATIQLTSQPNWDNTGNAQSLPRTATIAKGIQAAKVDPPASDEQKLDRYQTNYYFETGGRVYIFACVHNWIPELYSQCQTMLTTMIAI